MKRIVLAGWIALAAWGTPALGQANLGLPIPAGRCDSCAKPPGHAPWKAGWRSDCTSKFCQSSVGQLAREMLTPLRVATGNLLPICCADTITREDVERMILDGHYSPAEITAAKIKLDESQAHARRAAVRYLAGVNCHYYPEAECGLIAALRADRNECVRLEAAVALTSCNCLTAKIAEALSVSASGMETDGNPGEISERVRTAARTALARYHSRGVGLSPNMLPPSDWTPPPPVNDTAPRPGPFSNPITIQPIGAFHAVTSQEVQRAESISGNNVSSKGYATGQRTLFHLLREAVSPREGTAGPSVAPVASVRSPSLRPLGLRTLGSEANLAMPNP